MKGMLWFDNDKATTLAQKVQRAAEHYRNKYGRTPTICLVNPKMVGDETAVDSIRVKPDRYTMLNHFLIGVGEA